LKDPQANNAIKEALKAYNNRELAPLLPNGEKKPIKSVSKYYGIPKSTFSDRKVGRYSTVDHPQFGRSLSSQKKNWLIWLIIF